MTPDLERLSRLIPIDPEPTRGRPWWGLLGWGAVCAGLGLVVGRWW